MTNEVPKILKKGKELNDWKKKNTPEFCPLCFRKMSTIITKNHTVDHDHDTGKIRKVLCRNCNSLEGKIHNICIRAGKYIDNVEFLHNVIQLWEDKHLDVYYPGTKIVGTKIVPPPKAKRKRRVKP